MATLYWGPSGGTSTGTWDASTTTNWFTDLARITPASSAPTSADDVVFDASSDNGTGFTVTIGTGAVCRDVTISGLDQTMTLAGTAAWTVYGSLSFPATNLTRTWAGTLTFLGTSSHTITTNGVGLSGASITIIINTATGTYTLGSALTMSTSSGVFRVTSGTFDTGANYTLTATRIETSGNGPQTINLNASTLSMGGVSAASFTSSGLTLNAGTSTYSCIRAAGAVLTSSGAALTFYNVTFAGVAQISGSITCTNLTLTSPAATGLNTFTLTGNQTVTGTLTLGAANTAIRRIYVKSDVVGTQRTLTVATLATLADVDFQDIKAAGASSPWSGTRIGNCGGNSNITFTAASDKYWYSATGAGGNWSAAQWETTAGGTTPSVNNFPLAQDTVKFQNTGLNTGNTLTIDTTWNLPAIDGTARTNAMTLASGTQTLTIFGDLTIVSAMTITGTGSWRFSKQGTQNVTTNGVTVTWPVNVENGTGSVKLIDNWTSSNSITLTTGGLDLNDKTATCLTLSSSNSNTRSIAFGTGKIVATGNATTVIGVGVLTNFSYTGTPVIESNYSGSTGTRTINFGQGGGATESNVMTLKISAGSDTVAITTGMSCKTLDTSGFSGTITSGTKQIYADLIVGATTIWAASAVSITFSATSGTQNFTTNGVTIDQSVIVNGGAIVAMIDALTLGSTRTLTLSAGTLKLKNGTTNTVGTWTFSGTVSNPITLQSTTPGSQATISDASGTSNATYLTVQDIVATGGATFNAFTGSGSTTSNNNVNSGNNLGWYFIPPGATFMGFF